MEVYNDLDLPLIEFGDFHTAGGASTGVWIIAGDPCRQCWQVWSWVTGCKILQYQTNKTISS